MYGLLNKTARAQKPNPVGLPETQYYTIYIHEIHRHYKGK